MKTRKNRPAPTRPAARELYSSIEALPFDRFIRVVCTKDPQHLVKAGSFTQEELREAWAAVYLEYLDAAGQSSQDYKFQLLREVSALETRITSAETLLRILQDVYAPELADLLEGLGFDRLEYDPEDLDSYFEQLDYLWHQSREAVIDLKLKAAELEQLVHEEAEKEAAGTTQATPQHFTRILNRIATFRRLVVIRPAEITTAEFCAMLQEYQESEANKPAPTAGLED